MTKMNVQEMIAALGQMTAEEKASLASVLGVQAPVGNYAWTFKSADKYETDPNTGKPVKSGTLGQYPVLIGPGLASGRGSLKHKASDFLTIIANAKPLLEMIVQDKLPADAAMKPGETRGALIERAKAILAKHYK